jgi:hypothetical protein
VLEHQRAETQRQHDAAIAARDSRVAGGFAEVIAALDARLTAIAKIERTAASEADAEDERASRDAIERERAEVLAEMTDSGAEFEAHGRVGVQVWDRYEARHARPQAWERKRMSHAARHGSAPEPIPLFVDGGILEPMGGITQRFLRACQQIRNEFAAVERHREGLKNPPPPPEPRRYDPARDKRIGVVTRFRPGPGTMRIDPDTLTRTRR